MIRTSIPKRRMMSWCLGSVFTIGICFTLIEIFCCNVVPGKTGEIKVISLPNEKCDVRPTLITIGTDEDHYYPLMISLHRCGGVCGSDKPTFRRCETGSSNNIYVNAFNKLSLKNETLKFENHTSCSCKCAFDNSVCTKSQVWDENQCKCICAASVTSSQCPDNYIWNPNFCKCECDLSCTSKQTLNNTRCSCDCKAKYYKRCNRKKKILQESNCKCYKPKPIPSKKIPCSTLPTKWAALIIVISFCAFFIVAFDCILYCKSTGCIYKSTHMCVKDHRNIRNRHETSTLDDVVDIVHCRGVKM